MSLDAVVHLRITTDMHAKLEAIANGRRSQRLVGHEKRLHGLVRELLGKRGVRFGRGGKRSDPRPLELTGEEPTRLLHVRVPRALLEELKSMAAGVGPRDGTWEPMPFSGYVRGRL